METSNTGMAKIGVIGLAVMGSNLARNFASRGIKTAVFNRTYQRTLELIAAHGPSEFKDGGGLAGFEKIEEFVASLEKPRRIILMVQAGSPVDEVVGQLMPLLESGDYIIDGGNSFFEDTERRHRECNKDGAAKAVNFLGMGISGGEEGALLGPSLMPGLSTTDWPHFESLLGGIAAKDFGDKPCVAPMGPGGAGHYVKMVHNGIEYAIMQIIAEIYDFNRKALGLGAAQIGDIFEKINAGEYSSFLAEITAKVLKHAEAESKKPMVDMIMDKASQKGTGGWTSIESIKLGTPSEMIGEAVAARSLSAFKDIRSTLAAKVKRETIKSNIEIDWDRVLFFGMLMAYTQGLFLIKLAAQTYKWPTDLAEVCRIWQGGCIIRSKMLVPLSAAFAKDKNLNLILTDENILNLTTLPAAETGKFIIEAVKSGIATPAISSSYNYFLGISDAQSPANLIQGLRDFFGAHTFERTDKPGTFHENWTN